MARLIRTALITLLVSISFSNLAHAAIFIEQVFPLPRFEYGGLAFDGSHFYVVEDGTVLRKFTPLGVQVYEAPLPFVNIEALEFIDGELYAISFDGNSFVIPDLIKIDPATGNVLSVLAPFTSVPSPLSFVPVGLTKIGNEIYILDVGKFGGNNYDLQIFDDQFNFLRTLATDVEDSGSRYRKGQVNLS